MIFGRRKLPLRICTFKVVCDFSSLSQTQAVVEEVLNKSHSVRSYRVFNGQVDGTFEVQVFGNVSLRRLKKKMEYQGIRLVSYYWGSRVPNYAGSYSYSYPDCPFGYGGSGWPRGGFDYYGSGDCRYNHYQPYGPSWPFRNVAGEYCRSRWSRGGFDYNGDGYCRYNRCHQPHGPYRPFGNVAFEYCPIYDRRPCSWWSGGGGWYDCM